MAITENKPCEYCLSAFNDSELEPGKDFSSMPLCGNESFRLMLNAGNGKPVTLTAEKLTLQRWVTVGSIEPDFCPVCGRDLREEKRNYHCSKTEMLGYYFTI